jgi:hypothetical protein
MPKPCAKHPQQPSNYYGNNYETNKYWAYISVFNTHCFTSSPIFIAMPLRLIIEVDGSIHNLPAQYQYDELRTLELSNYGITVLRFKNEQVINHIQIVLEEISKQAQILLAIQTPL